MKVVYNSTTIENIMSLLNRLQITGIANVEIMSYIVKELSNTEIIDTGSGVSSVASQTASTPHQVN